MANPQRQCIFCGDTGLTKEHIWPNWLRQYIPRTKINYHSQSGILFKTHTKSKISHHAGDPHSSTVRVVCKSCNSGWMSGLQTKAKPILIPLLGGEHIPLRKPEQSVLAAWITMFTMVAEFKLRPSDLVAIPGSERKQFKGTQRALKNWKIWIGLIENKAWMGKYDHATFCVSSEDNVMKTSEGVPIPNTQATTFVVGKLYVHALSSSSMDLRKQQVSTRLVQRLWPNSVRLLKWPPRHALSDGEAEGISRAFLRSVAKKTGAAYIP